MPLEPNSVRMVAVVGGDPCTEEEADFAEALARLLPERGLGVVTGGLGGVMEAACRGAREAGGLTVGILPGANPGAANPFVEVAVPTGMGELRNGLVVRAAEVVVAVGGEYGTLSEIALALKAGKPVIGWRTWNLDRRPQGAQSIIAVTSAEEAAEKVGQALTSDGVS
ncbi:MAG TPA: TIGR00725 family protein [Chloroflexota bacterium]|nr:TIGR00725 family protein [Chloroflexota bacterium]